MLSNLVLARADVSGPRTCFQQRKKLARRGEQDSEAVAAEKQPKTARSVLHEKVYNTHPDRTHRKPKS